MTILINQLDVSAWVEKITWSGDRNQIARKLSFSLAYSREDSNIPIPVIDNGNTVTMLEATLLFTGVIISISRQESSTVLSVTAVDLAWYTGKVKTYGIYTGFPAEIAKQVCGEYDIMTGRIDDAGGSKEVISAGDKTIYQVIADAYSDLDYMMYMTGSTLHIAIAGNEIVAELSGDIDVTDATYTSSIENMVNKVVILDDKAAYAGEVTEDTHIRQYGLMQETYKKENDQDMVQAAAKLLKGIEETGSITAIGNLACTAGKAVYITDVNSHITGRFTIQTDTHTFEGAMHTMSLGLEFKEVV